MCVLFTLFVYSLLCGRVFLCRILDRRQSHKLLMLLLIVRICRRRINYKYVGIARSILYFLDWLLLDNLAHFSHANLISTAKYIHSNVIHRLSLLLVCWLKFFNILTQIMSIVWAEQQTSISCFLLLTQGLRLIMLSHEFFWCCSCVRRKRLESNHVLESVCRLRIRSRVLLRIRILCLVLLIETLERRRISLRIPLRVVLRRLLLLLSSSMMMTVAVMMAMIVIAAIPNCMMMRGIVVGRSERVIVLLGSLIAQRIGLLRMMIDKGRLIIQAQLLLLRWCTLLSHKLQWMRLLLLLLGLTLTWARSCLNLDKVTRLNLR